MKIEVNAKRILVLEKKCGITGIWRVIAIIDCMPFRIYDTEHSYQIMEAPKSWLNDDDPYIDIRIGDRWIEGEGAFYRNDKRLED